MSKTRDLANLADLNFDSGTMVVDKVNDRVGVLNATPSHPFQVGTDDLIVDASGNLLVGKTSLGAVGAGSGFGATGINYMTADDATTLRLNRESEDGEIVSFRKDNVPVGSIGSVAGLYTAFKSNGSNLYLGVNNSLDISLDSTRLRPTSNATMSLGDGSRRFTDLSLTGGVYLGGGSTKLDSYEEGTWTPIFSDSTGSDKYSGYNIQSGYYRKVGSLCMCGFDMLGSTVTSTSGTYLTISGLPFSSNPAGNPTSIVNIAYMQNIGHATLQGGYVNNSHLYLTVSGITHASPSTLSNSARVIGGFTYITT